LSPQPVRGLFYERLRAGRPVQAGWMSLIPGPGAGVIDGMACPNFGQNLVFHEIMGYLEF
jgi:hypothetical protein